MCGFAGRFHPTSLPPDKDWQIKADRLLRHRGPDGSGHFADECCDLVHRRLALIDLSPTGLQPMQNEDGNVIVVFNGEIYNHRELRIELEGQGHSFRGSSDTEVLVHLYEECGQEMVERLRGMYAFAIYDRRQRLVLLARDRFGIKPLYYASLKNQSVFASEIKAILAVDHYRPRINRQACYDFLGLGYIPEPQTGFSEIRALPPGCTLVFDSRGERLTEHTRVKASPNQSLAFSNAVEATSQAILQSVSSQSLADVPVAALLSGGIDSSLVVAAYCQISDESPTTFNISFPDQAYDETFFARSVSDHYHTKHNTITLDDLAITPELVQKLLLHFDQPFADSSLIPTYVVSKAIRDQGIICALSGDGGDEVFGGYACFWRANRFARMMQMPRLLQSAAARAGNYLINHTENFGRQLSKAFQLSRACLDDSSILLAGLSSYLSEAQKEEIVLPEARQQMQYGSRHFDGYGSEGTSDLEELSLRMTETLFKVGLTSDMLRKVDMMSMLAGIEVRVPLLDEEVVDCGLSLPHHLKTDGKTGKRVPREIARRWLPKQVASHRKQGFAIPLDRMATASFHELLSDLLLSPAAKIRNFLNIRIIEQWLKKFKEVQHDPSAGSISREGLYQRIVILLSLELWLREHNLDW